MDPLLPLVSFFDVKYMDGCAAVDRLFPVKHYVIYGQSLDAFLLEIHFQKLQLNRKKIEFSLFETRHGELEKFDFPTS